MLIASASLDKRRGELGTGGVKVSRARGGRVGGVVDSSNYWQGSIAASHPY